MGRSLIFAFGRVDPAFPRLLRYYRAQYCPYPCIPRSQGLRAAVKEHGQVPNEDAIQIEGGHSFSVRFRLCPSGWNLAYLLQCMISPWQHQLCLMQFDKLC
jgi:hypothetical protein